MIKATSFDEVAIVLMQILKVIIMIKYELLNEMKNNNLTGKSGLVKILFFVE